jgi:hypothetical protein
MDSPRGASHHTPKCVLLRIASYAEMRIAAQGLRKKFAAEQCSSSGVRIFVKCAELLLLVIR